MKIGFFTDGYLPQRNGVSTSVCHFAKELEKLGHEVYIIAPKYPNYQDEDSNVIRLTSVKVLRKPELRVALHVPDKALRRVLSIDFDMIHGHSGGPITLLGWEIARTKNIPYVATYHTTWSKYTHYVLKGKVFSPKMLEHATRIFANQCTQIVAPSLKAKKELVSFGVKKPIAVIPSGVETSVFDGGKSDYLKKELGLDGDSRIALSVGRLGKEKSIDFLLSAAELVLKEVSNFHLVLVGDGPEKSHLMRLAKTLKIEKNVRFLGEVEQDKISDIYRSANIFVFSSSSETQGMVLAEAAASSLPIIAVRDSATNEIVKNNETGFLTGKNKKEFASRIIKVLEDSDLYERFSKNAKEGVSALDISETTKHLEKLYKGLIEKSLRDSVARVMEFQSLREKIFVVNATFWVVVLISHIAMLSAPKTDVYAVMHVFDYVVPLVSVGFFFLALAFLTMLFRKKDLVLPFVFLGISLGLLSSEASSIFTSFHSSFNQYWSFGNLISVFIVGVTPSVLLKTLFKKSPKFKFMIRGKHENPTNPEISVVVPAYNEEKFLQATLESLLNQSIQNFELIVVDNNSIDRTADVAREFGARVVSEKHPGVAYARQAGFMAAKGKIIATTDADTIVPYNWLETIEKGFDKKRIVAFGGLNRLYSGPVTARAAARYMFSAFWIADKYLSGGWNLMGSNLAVRSETFHKIGGFSTNLTLGEDIDLAKRLREHGEIEFDTDFVVFSSGRRFRQGFIMGELVYAPSYVARVLLKQDKFLTFPTIRTEHSVVGRLWSLPILFATGMTIVLFILARMRRF